MKGEGLMGFPATQEFRYLMVAGKGELRHFLQWCSSLRSLSLVNNLTSMCLYMTLTELIGWHPHPMKIKWDMKVEEEELEKEKDQGEWEGDKRGSRG